jgi:hypothetical protein
MQLSSLTTALVFLSFVSTVSATPVAVHTGSLILNLNANAFTTAVDPGLYSGYGLTMIPPIPHAACGCP